MHRERWVPRLLLAAACAIGLFALSSDTRAGAIPAADVARLALINSGGIPVITAGLLPGYNRPIASGVNYVVTATTTPTAVEHATLCGPGGNATIHNLHATTPVCTGYSPAGATLTCNPGAGGTGIGVCRDSTVCAGTVRNSDVGRGVLFYMVQAGTLADVIIECAGLP